MKRKAGKKPLNKEQSKHARTQVSRTEFKSMTTTILEGLQLLMNWFTEKEPFPFLSLSQELQLYIMQYLCLHDLIRLTLVCKDTTDLACDNSLWKKYALQYQVPLTNADGKPLFKNYKDIIKSCIEVRKNYPQETIDIFGNENDLAEIPVMDPSYGPNPYTNFLVSDLKGHKLMRGTSSNHEPFVAFCVKSFEMTPGEDKHLSKLETYSIRLSNLSQLSHNKEFIVTYYNGEKFKTFRVNDPLFPPLQEYFRRLIRNEPCQPLREPFEQTLVNPPRSMMVTLTDQSELQEEPVDTVYNIRL